jgi:putative CocE/NonD family hydrolase
MGRRGVLVLGVAAVVFAHGAATAQAVVTKCNEAITMSDGLVMRANVVLPDAQTKRPVILTATGYNKDATNPTGTQCGSGGILASVDQDLLKAGYAVMLLDDRGTGASQGQWDFWGERTQEDYGEVLDWIQAQPWSDGQVGVTGGSYMGITSMLVAEADAGRVAAGKPRAVKAVWADVPMSDAYRDVTFHGGAIDVGFIPLWLGLTTTLSDIPPSTLFQEPLGSLPTYALHLLNTFDVVSRHVVDAALGGDSAFDGPFFRLRSPGTRAGELKIPVAWVGGWWDIFQRGEPLLFEQLVNSPRRLFFMTPNYHGLPDQAAWDALKVGSEQSVKVRWFDRYLRGAADAKLDAMAPVNLWTLGAKSWEHHKTWPLPGTKYTSLHLAPDSLLERDAPAAPSADAALLLPVSSPCSRLSMQWTAGLLPLGPCETDNRTFELTALKWTTTPLADDTKVTGPITADIWAELSSADATLVAVLSDVGPDGRSTQISGGFLLASQRAVDEERSTKAADGTIIRPWHPFTRASRAAVPPNIPQRYRIEIYPTSNVFKKGHSIRLTLSGANTPATLPEVPSLVGSLAGRLRVLHSAKYPSHVLLPFSGAEPADVPLPSAKRCVSRRQIRVTVRGARRGERIRKVVATVGGKRVKTLRHSGRWYVPVDLRRKRAGRVQVRIRVTTTRGRTIESRRRYRACVRS